MDYDVILGYNFYNTFNPLFNYSKKEFYLFFNIFKNKNATEVSGQDLPLETKMSCRIRSNQICPIAIDWSDVNLKRVFELGEFSVFLKKEFLKLGIRIVICNLRNEEVCLILRNANRSLVRIPRQCHIASLFSKHIFDCESISENWELIRNNNFVHKVPFQLSCQSNIVAQQDLNGSTSLDIKINKHLNDRFKINLLKILELYSFVFSKNEFDVGHNTEFKLHVNLKPGSLVNVKQYRMNQEMREILRGILGQFLKAEIIRKSVSIFNFPILLVWKPNNQFRAVVDLRQVNMCVQESFPLIHLQTAVESLKSALVSQPVLTLFDSNIPISIHADVSEVAAGAVLVQNSKEGDKIIAYFSKKLTPNESNFFISERELFAVILALRE